MTNYTINLNWFNEIKHLVPNANAYHYDNMVEVDVDEEAFIRVSKELGWME